MGPILIQEKKFLIQKIRLPSPSPSMTRKLRLFAWALTLQILPLHAQEEDHSNDDIQDPNTPISLVCALFFSFSFFYLLVFFTLQIRAHFYYVQYIL